MKKTNNIMAIAILLILLLILYVTSYWLNVQRNGNVSLIGHFEEGQILEISPTYHFGGKLAETIYLPLQSIDRQIRPDYWTWTYHSSWFSPTNIHSRTNISGP